MDKIFTVTVFFFFLDIIVFYVGGIWENWGISLEFKLQFLIMETLFYWVCFNFNSPKEWWVVLIDYIQNSHTNTWRIDFLLTRRWLMAWRWETFIWDGRGRRHYAEMINEWRKPWSTKVTLINWFKMKSHLLMSFYHFKL